MRTKFMMTIAVGVVIILSLWFPVFPNGLQSLNYLQHNTWTVNDGGVVSYRDGKLVLRFRTGGSNSLPTLFILSASSWELAHTSQTKTQYAQGIGLMQLSPHPVPKRAAFAGMSTRSPRPHRYYRQPSSLKAFRNDICLFHKPGWLPSGW